MSLSDVDSILDEAVLSYCIVRKLRLLKRTPSGASDRKLAESLVDDYPDHYTLQYPKRHVRFVGKSAGDILEDYLRELGYEAGSDLWFSLAQIVIERGELEGRDFT